MCANLVPIKPIGRSINYSARFKVAFKEQTASKSKEEASIGDKLSINEVKSPCRISETSRKEQLIKRRLMRIRMVLCLGFNQQSGEWLPASHP